MQILKLFLLILKLILLILKQKSPTDVVEDILTYRPIHDVAPSAVKKKDPFSDVKKFF